MARFQALLRSAQKTRYYRPLLEAALLAPESVASLWSVEGALARLPRVDSSTRRSHPGAFRNVEARKPVPQRLFCPLPPVRRTALLMAGFKHERGVKVFETVNRRKLAKFRPNVLAGTVGLLRRLAEGAEDRGARVPLLTHAVIAFNIPLRSFLSEEARELFWRVFQVPVFSQFLGTAGELLAWECEVHEGLHILSDNAVFEVEQGDGEPELLVTSLINLRNPMLRLATGLTATIQNSLCGCGQPGPRLIGLRRRSLSKRSACTLASASCAAD